MSEREGFAGTFGRAFIGPPLVWGNMDLRLRPARVNVQTDGRSVPMLLRHPAVRQAVDVQMPPVHAIVAGGQSVVRTRAITGRAEHAD